MSVWMNRASLKDPKSECERLFSRATITGAAITFSSNRGNTKRKRLNCKMMGTTRFSLDAPDQDTGPRAPLVTGGTAPDTTGTQQQAAEGAGAVPAPPRLPYAPDPGTYTQLWMSESAGTSAADMAAECETYLEAFGETPVDYNAIVMSLLAASDGMVFLTVLTGNQVCPVHSIGRFSCGLGKHTPSHNRIFGLLGEKIGESLPPVAMVPAAGLAPWFQIEDRHQPRMVDLAGLETSRDRTVGGTRAGIFDSDEEEEQPKVSVQKLVMIPKAWAPYFLEPQSPWEALQTYQTLLRTIPEDKRDSFDFIEAWLSVACTHDVKKDESVLKAKWQNPHADRRMLEWMLRHTRFVNSVPMMMGPGGGTSLDPQECFNKALETVAALKPTAEVKRYSDSELRRLRAACSLSEPEMLTSLPPFHQQLLAEGRTKRGAEAVLAQALRPDEHSDDPGLIYISPELVADIKDCKYGLGWDTSYKNCHRGLSPFAVPHMALHHQQERTAYQDRLVKASTTTVSDIEKGESTPNAIPADYHGLLQLLSGYIKLLATVVGSRSAHTREVIAIRKKLRTRMDIYVDIGPQKILYLLWAIFLDARDFFSREVQSGEPLPESQLRYTTNFIGVGRIPADIMGVPVDQFGLDRPIKQGRAISASTGSSQDMFRPADYVPHRNKEVPDDISLLTTPLMDKFPTATTEALMSHGNLKYEDIRVGNKGACLNYNLLGICKDPNCTYRHTLARPTDDRIKAVRGKLEPAIQAYIAEGGKAKKRKRAGTY
jgi:hypothetical protein